MNNTDLCFLPATETLTLFRSKEVSPVELLEQFDALICPVLAVPSGVPDNGVPTGVQIVGRTYDDATTFRLALAYEAALGGFPHAPGVTA